MNKITHEFVSNWQNLNAEADKMEGLIVERVDYIIKTWFQIFGGKVDYWYFQGAEENQERRLAECMNDYVIYPIFVMEKAGSKHTCIIDKNSKIYEWQSEVPTRWLYEDFEDEIFNGKKLYEDKMAAKKEKSKLSKEQKKIKINQLAEAAKAKLTPEELKALKQTIYIEK